MRKNKKSEIETQRKFSPKNSRFSGGKSLNRQYYFGKTLDKLWSNKCKN